MTARLPSARTQVAAVVVVSDIEWLGHWLGIVSWALAGWAGLALFWHTGRPRAGLFACVLITLQPLITHSIGMETPFLALLMLAVAWAWMTNRRWPTIIFSAALLLTRQDAALWLLCLGVGRWWREKRFPIYEAAGALLLTLPWFVFAQVRYGSFVPNSVIARLGQNSVMPVGGQALFPQMFRAHWTGGAHPALIIAMVMLAGVGMWAALREPGRFAWLIAWTALYLFVYTWLFVRHYHPVARFGRATLFEREPEAEHRYRAETTASYARGFSLVGIEAPTQTLEAGAMWDVQLSFEVNARPAFDCQLVVDLLNARSFDRVSLFKHLPPGGAYGCDVWQPGEQLQDEFIIMTPATLAAGNYQLRAGFYSAEGRLPLADGKADFVTLSQIDPIQIRR